ncbi:hypothetical protein [uncultured Bacteroides sp.]|uniref:hypothetical protein n=1 Tax=uncultured Bacteroides sp. TaxID=162156 RepID=UPI002618FA7C|nr:hypothetical protein [uncultured Bacteroides sp.]
MPTALPLSRPLAIYNPDIESTTFFSSSFASARCTAADPFKTNVFSDKESDDKADYLAGKKKAA